MTRLFHLSNLQRRLLFVWLLPGVVGCAYRDAPVALPLEEAPEFSSPGEVPLPDRW